MGLLAYLLEMHLEVIAIILWAWDWALHTLGTLYSKLDIWCDHWLNCVQIVQENGAYGCLCVWGRRVFVCLCGWQVFVYRYVCVPHGCLRASGPRVFVCVWPTGVILHVLVEGPFHSVRVFVCKWPTSIWVRVANGCYFSSGGSGSVLFCARMF